MHCTVPTCKIFYSSHFLSLSYLTSHLYVCVLTFSSSLYLSISFSLSLSLYLFLSSSLRPQPLIHIPSQPMAVAPGLPQQASAPSAPDSGLVPVPEVEELLSASVVSAINARCKVRKYKKKSKQILHKIKS